MKKLLLILTILVIASTGMAQKSERTNAFMYNKNAQYDKAKEAIDKAVVHPRTAEDAKAWMYRGIIYLNLVFSEDYANLSEDPLQESFNSFKKAIELDPDDKLKRSNDIDPRVEAIGQQYFAYGVDDFNAGQNDPNKYKVAANKFHKAYEVAAYVNKIDTLALLNAALASVRAEAYEQALEYYEQLLALDFNESDVYKNMALAHRNLGDNDAMFATLKAGREKYPDDAGLMLEEINAYLSIGQGAKVVDDLKLLIEKDPTNYSIFFVLGTIYGDEANPEMFDLETAEMYYAKSLEIEPDYYDAVYNLGALYINESNKLQVAANELPLDETKKYDEMTEEANAIIMKALPLLEKSNELQPGNEETLSVLRSIYIRFNMTDKLESIKE